MDPVIKVVPTHRAEREFVFGPGVRAFVFTLAAGLLGMGAFVLTSVFFGTLP